MLELRGIAKRYGRFALEALDLKVMSNEYCVLLGPSGAGKTVILEMLAGLIRPDAGQVLWDGRDITSAAPETRRFAMVYQDYALFPHMSVRANIAFGLRSRGVSRTEAEGRAEAVARNLGIAELLARRPATMSGGEQQRVALARALATEPKLLLLDEPLAAVDIAGRRRLRDQLKQLQQQTHTTFLHVTHDIDEAMFLADRVAVILGGRLRQVAPPEELFRRPSDRDVARFLGMRNILDVVCDEPGQCLARGVTIHVADSDVSTRQVWIRPEEVILSGQPFDSSARNQFRGHVAQWSRAGDLLAVEVDCGELELTALVTYASFEHLAIQKGTQVYATFKSSATHCF